MSTAIEHEVRRLFFKVEVLRHQSKKDFELDLKLKTISDACIDTANFLAIKRKV